MKRSEILIALTVLLGVVVADNVDKGGKLN